MKMVKSSLMLLYLCIFMHNCSSNNCAGGIWRRHMVLDSYLHYLRVSYSSDMQQYLHLVLGW